MSSRRKLGTLQRRPLSISKATRNLALVVTVAAEIAGISVEEMADRINERLDQMSAHPMNDA